MNSEAFINSRKRYIWYRAIVKAGMTAGDRNVTNISLNILEQCLHLRIALLYVRHFLIENRSIFIMILEEHFNFNVAKIISKYALLIRRLTIFSISS